MATVYNQSAVTADRLLAVDAEDFKVFRRMSVWTCRRKSRRRGYSFRSLNGGIVV